MPVLTVATPCLSGRAYPSIALRVDEVVSRAQTQRCEREKVGPIRVSAERAGSITRGAGACAACLIDLGAA